MKEADISRAMQERLATMPGVPFIVYENDDLPVNQARPYLALEMVRTGRKDPTLKGGSSTISQGFMQITIVASLDGFATGAERLSDSIMALFPRGTRITGQDGGTLTVTQSEAKQAYREGPDWRMPLHVDFWAS